MRLVILIPTTHHAAVPPGGRPSICRCGRRPDRDVRRDTNRGRTYLSRSDRGPVAALPDGAHLRFDAQIVGKRVAGAGVQVDLHSPDIAQGLARGRQRGAEPPFDVGGGGRPEGVQPAARRLGDSRSRAVRCPASPRSAPTGASTWSSFRRWVRAQSRPAPRAPSTLRSHRNHCGLSGCRRASIRGFGLTGRRPHAAGPRYWSSTSRPSGVSASNSAEPMDVS